VFWILVLLSVAFLGGLIAYLGDVVGRKVGRKHMRLFGLRPKTTGLVVAVGSGVLVALVTVGAVGLLAQSTVNNAFRANEINQEYQTAKQQLASVEEEYALSREDLSKAKAAQKLLEQQLNTGKIQLDAGRAELERKDSELAAQVDLITKFTAKAKMLETERLNLGQQIKDKTKLLDTKNTELEQRNAQITALGRESNSKIKNLDVEIKALNLQRNQLRDNLSKLDIRRATLENTITGLRNDKIDLEKRYASAKAQLEPQKARLAKLENDVRTLAAQRETLNTDVTELTQARLELQQSLATLETQNNDLQTQLGDTKRSLQQTQEALIQATSGNFLYRQGELILQIVIPNGSVDETRTRMQNLLKAASQIAEGRGGTKGRSVNLKPNADLETFVQQAIKTNAPDLILVRSSKNLPRVSEPQIPVTLEVRPNTVLFSNGQPIKSREIAVGTGDKRPVLSMKTALENLNREVSNELRSRGVPLENIPTDIVTDADIGDFVERLKKLEGNTSVGIAASQDVLPSGPMKFYLMILR
jgi:predicted  nucleic acid-binding Zn-ribbon protein